MMAQRLRRWATIKTILDQLPMLLVTTSGVRAAARLDFVSWAFPNKHEMFTQCWTNLGRRIDAPHGIFWIIIIHTIQETCSSILAWTRVFWLFNCAVDPYCHIRSDSQTTGLDRWRWVDHAVKACTDIIAWTRVIFHLTSMDYYQWPDSLCGIGMEQLANRYGSHRWTANRSWSVVPRTLSI